MDFIKESLLSAGISEEDAEFYVTARIAYNDSISWNRLINIQTKLILKGEQA